jgi:malonate-semialdehyde dehydrogenase (acetylating)/methylmalonate-semialdehyde dehydrogenase
MAISVAVAVGNVADQLIDRLVPRVKALVIKNGEHRDAEMGPLVTAEHKAKVADYIASGEAQGAKLIVDGRAHPVSDEAGFFIGGTLFDHVGTQMKIYKKRSSARCWR